MKRVVLLGITVTTICFVKISYANFVFYLNDTNACEHISGLWSGKGKAENWLIKCVYQGVEEVTPVDKKGNFTLIVSGDKDSGNFVCPGHIDKVLEGTCIDGVVTIVTEYGNLQGDFSENYGVAKGILSFTGDVTAEICAKFARA